MKVYATFKDFLGDIEAKFARLRALESMRRESDLGIMMTLANSHREEFRSFSPRTAEEMVERWVDLYGTRKEVLDWYRDQLPFDTAVYDREVEQLGKVRVGTTQWGGENWEEQIIRLSDGLLVRWTKELWAWWKKIHQLDREWSINSYHGDVSAIPPLLERNDARRIAKQRLGMD